MSAAPTPESPSPDAIREPAKSRTDTRRAAAWKHVPPLTGGLTVLVSGAVLLGWMFDLPFLKSVLPGLPVMVPNTALCLLLAGLALGQPGNDQAAPFQRRLGQVCALLVTVVGLLTLAEYLFRSSLGLDLLLVRSASAFPGNAYPGRPSPQTAIVLCLFGSALLLSRQANPRYSGAQLLAIVAALIALTALTGYLYQVLFFYGVSTTTGMAVHTALVCLALALGILCASADHGLMTVLTSDSAGGIMARRLLPAVILFPLVLGWLRLLGERNRLYGPAFGVSLMVLVTVLLLVGLVLWNADRLHTLDARRQEALDALRQANEELEARVRARTADLNAQREWLRVTLTSIGDAVIATDTNGHVTFMNPVAEALTGWKQAEALGKALQEVFVIANEETRQEVENPVTKVLREGTVVGLANHTVLLGREGTEIPIADSGAPIRDAEGRLQGVVLVFHDVTESRRHEQEQRAVMSGANCLLWYADVWDSGEEYLHWDLKPVNAEAAQRLLPLEVPPGQTYAVAWAESRLPEDTLRMDRLANRVIREGRSYAQEFRCRNARGEIRWMREDVHVETVAPQRWRLVGVTTDITERKQMEEALRESEERTRLIVETALDAVVTMDASGTITGWNAQAEAVFGWPRSEVIGRSLSETIVPPAYREAHEKGLRYFLATGEGSLLNRRVEITALHRSGREFPVELAISPARVGDTYTFSAFVRDITERKRLEDQLLQAQKMESVGRLAGGIAHDFNNLLTAILGYAELAEDETDPQEVRQYLSHVRQAAEKASDLTRQLLTFARRQIIAPRTVNINDLILSLDKLLRRLIGENIELVMLPKEGLHSVKVDPGQFEQILVNLVVNSRDAMPDGGKITIETANVTLDAEYARQHEEVVPGEYVLLAVSDTGSGMEEAIRLHIFEPFFTTKEKGRGTGLGLATVYGIVKQSGGHIWLYSEPGEGTAFKIYLPRTTETPEAVSNAPRKTVQPGGSETILLVEDEPAVRALAAQTLQARGYAVIEAMNGEEALRLVKGREAQIRLLITDVVMPQMNGKELAERLQALHPGMKVLYSSGYTENTIVHHGVLKPGIAFLSKPFTPTMLAGKVREVLDSGASR